MARLVLEAPGLYPGLSAFISPIWLAFHGRLVAGLRDVWNCVKGVLCNDAPEGFVPDDIGAEPSINTKDILSYCWRALKESRWVVLYRSVRFTYIASSLLRVLVSKTPIHEGDRSMLSQNQFESLARLAFTELVELRHRGAFSAVAQSFAACCVKANALGRDDLLRNLYMVELRFFPCACAISNQFSERSGCHQRERFSHDAEVCWLAFAYCWCSLGLSK